MHRNINRFVRALKRGWRATRRAEQATESLLLMAERCGDAVFRFGADGKARYISPSVERLFGCTRAEIYATGGNIGSNGFIHPAD